MTTKKKRQRHDMAAASIHYACSFAYVRGVIDTEARQANEQEETRKFFGKADVVRRSLRCYIQQFYPHEPCEFETILDRFYWQYYQQQAEFLKNQ